MSRVEKELASLAPWAWDPLVGKHAPGSAMMRDFTEVVADKTVTGNTDSYRFNQDSLHPHSATGTPAHAHVGGKRARSPPWSVAAPPPATAQRHAAASPASRRRATPTTAPVAARLHTASKPRSVLGTARGTGNGTSNGNPNGTLSAKVPTGKTARRDASAAAAVGKNLEDALDAATRDDDDDEDAEDAKARAEAAKAAAKASAKAIRREKDAAAKREKRRAAAAAAAAASVGRDAGGDVPGKAGGAGKENAAPANGDRTDARSVPSGSFSVPVPVPASVPAVPRELAALDPLAPAESRRRREAALLAVAAAEAAAAAKPRVTPSQHLLATYYKLTGRTPPPGSVAGSVGSSRAPDRERETKAEMAAATENADAVARAPPVRCVVVSPFRGAEMRRPEDFARYDAQPLRVVPFTAELARACVYLDRRDARDAAAEAKAAA